MPSSRNSGSSFLSSHCTVVVGGLYLWLRREPRALARTGQFNLQGRGQRRPNLPQADVKLAPPVAPYLLACSRAGGREGVQDGSIRCVGAQGANKRGTRNTSVFRSDERRDETPRMPPTQPVLALRTVIAGGREGVQDGSIRCVGAQGANKRGTRNTSVFRSDERRDETPRMPPYRPLALEFDAA